MKRLSYLSALAAACLVLSCESPAPPGRPTIQLVLDIQDGNYPSYAEVLAAHKAPNADDDICIAGSSNACSLMCRDFMQCDMRDNAHGGQWSDGLKDFAGETFSCLNDPRPFKEFLAESATDSLRELAVRMSIAALETKCNISVYDLDGNGGKASSKVIVFPDPWISRFGYFDVDTLFSLTSCGVHLISSQDLLFSAPFSGKQKSFSIGLIGDSTCVGTGIYPELFKEKVNKYNIVGAKFFEGKVDSPEGALFRFLDIYAATSSGDMLDAILLDDLTISADELRDELEIIRDLTREESMTYGKLISPDVVIYSSSELTMSECYSVMRSENLFTHKIAQPAMRQYSIVPRPWADDMQFLLIPSSNVQN